MVPITPNTSKFLIDVRATIFCDARCPWLTQQCDLSHLNHDIIAWCHLSRMTVIFLTVDLRHHQDFSPLTNEYDPSPTTFDNIHLLSPLTN